MLPECTNQVQSLELSVNKSFKNVIREQLEKTPWWESKVDWCVYKELTVFETRVLITKWVTNVRLQKKTLKYDLTNKLDDSEDGDVNIKDIDNYEMSEHHLQTSIGLLGKKKMTLKVMKKLVATVLTAKVAPTDIDYALFNSIFGVGLPFLKNC